MALFNDLICTFDKVSGHEPDGMERIAPIGHHYVSNNNKWIIDVKINENGEFIDADVSNKVEGKTLLAVTEESCSRTSSAATTPHALNDSLLFMTPDYFKDKSGENKSFSVYMEQLQKWKDSSFSCDQIKAVYIYLNDHNLIEDLNNRKKLPEEKDGTVKIDKYSKALVRWIVIMQDDTVETRTWLNETVQKSWTDYYSDLHDRQCKEKSIDSIDGSFCDAENLHPKAVSAYGNSKLISVAPKEDSVLNFKGERFNNASQLMQISYKNSQKLHNALGWLIDTQSIPISNGKPDAKPKFIVCWSPTWDNDEDPFNAQFKALFRLKNNEDNSNYKSYKDRLKNIIDGLNNSKLITEKVSIFMIDRSGDGRFSPVLYRSYSAGQFLKKLKDWYESCCWFSWSNKEKKMILNSPSLFRIINCTFGVERKENDKGRLIVNDNVFKYAQDVLLAAVIDDRKIPDSFIQKIVAQASAPERFSDKWMDIFLTACALVHYKNIKATTKKGEMDMTLDRENTDRSYLFGRLLAVFDRVENAALYKKSSDVANTSSDHRDTNAMRLWSAYVAHPMTCFANLRKCVEPYMSSLKSGSRNFYENEIQEIVTKLDVNDKKLNRPLNADYLIGYYNERAELTSNSSSNKKTEQNESVND